MLKAGKLARLLTSEARMPLCGAEAAWAPVKGTFRGVLNRRASPRSCSRFSTGRAVPRAGWWATAWCSSGMTRSSAGWRNSWPPSRARPPLPDTSSNLWLTNLDDRTALKGATAAPPTPAACALYQA